MNQVSKIIIIIIIIIIKRIKGRSEQRAWSVERERLRGFYFFISLRFFFRSTKIGPQVFVGTEEKVDLRDESYAWVPKSWSFVKLHEAGNFPTCVISSLKVV